MKKPLVMYVLCFFIKYAFLLFYENDNIETVNTYYKIHHSIKNQNQESNEIECTECIEQETEDFDESVKNVAFTKTTKFKIPKVSKYKKVFIRPKFRIQTARSIIGDEGFANI